MDWKKIGIAHCIGMIGEAKELSDYLLMRGMEAYQPPQFPIFNDNPPVTIILM